jgi:hypothetical protein
MASLFVSHSSRDLPATKRVVERLAAEGFAALFLDFDPAQGIPAGRAWEQELYAQLRKTDAVVFLASAASVASQWCFAEVSLAYSLDKPVFPLRLDASVRLGLLDDMQWMDLADGELAFARLWAGSQRAGLDPSDSFGWDPARSPYPGLDSFAGEDAPRLRQGPRRTPTVRTPSNRPDTDRGSGSSSGQPPCPRCPVPQPPRQWPRCPAAQPAQAGRRRTRSRHSGATAAPPTVRLLVCAGHAGRGRGGRWAPAVRTRGHRMRPAGHREPAHAPALRTPATAAGHADTVAAAMLDSRQQNRLPPQPCPTGTRPQGAAPAQLAWLLANRRLTIRYERRADILTAFLHLAAPCSAPGSSDRCETTS